MEIIHGDQSVTFDAPTFGGAIRRALSDSATQRGIPAGFQRARAGDFSFLRNAVAQTTNLAAGLALGLNLSVTCTEDAPYFTAEDVKREAGGTFMGGHVAMSVKQACENWPRGSLPEGYHSLPRSDAPALILSGEVDPATPPSWGEEAARGLRNSRHVVMPGIAHAPFPQCAVNLMTAFVSAGSAAELDLACVGSLSRGPFQVPR